MPDLDGQLAGLRERLHDSVREPDPRRMAVLSRHRTARRRTQFGAVLAVLAVAAAIPLMRTVSQPAPDLATPSAAASTGPVLPVDPNWHPPVGPFLFGVGFADSRHGYALVGNCVGGLAYRCTAQLLAGADTGRWTRRNLPGKGFGIAGSLQVLGPSTLTVTAHTHPMARWFSQDGGRTWRQVSTDAAPPVAVIPPGAELQTVCGRFVGGGRQCAERRLAVLLPQSGLVAPLATQPPLAEPQPVAEPVGSGDWWVSGRDPQTRQWALSVSRDAGRSWSISRLPTDPNMPFTGVGITAHGDDVYAGALFDQVSTTGLAAIFHSGDGGRTWEQTWHSAGDSSAERYCPVPIAGADGALRLFTTKGALLVSHDHGRTFAEQGGPEPAVASVGWTRVGYVGQPADADSTTAVRAWLSPDGVRWTELRFD